MQDMLHLGIAWYVIFVASTVCHEAAHAFVAWRFGDHTAHQAGLVTLNPIPHIQREPLGMLVVPIIAFAMNGWLLGWGSSPYDPHWATRSPRRSALMSLAGPGTNLLLLLIAFGALWWGLAAGAFVPPRSPGFSHLVDATAPGTGWELGVTLLSVLFSLNLILFVFNMLPVPPLDGSQLIMLFLPTATANRYQRAIASGQWALMGLLIAWAVAWNIIRPIFDVAVTLLHPSVSYG
ncbi:MAG: site-2 protease family protein [Planctomycetota bacterium]